MNAALFFADLVAKALTLFDAETAHNLTIRLLKAGAGSEVEIADPRLETEVAGVWFPNPLGLAAGFDKNAEAPDAMLDLGFGFVEVGAVTPRPQPGNPRPRVFRLREDSAVINRYGFNSDGLDAVAARLRARKRRGVVGANLGANKDSKDRINDYILGVRALAGLVDFFTINISSPNTPGLRALHGKAGFAELLQRALAARAAVAPTTPVFLKISPDLTDEDKTDILAIAPATALDGFVISNTTVARPATLRSANAHEAGGLSGKPLFAPSTALLKEFYRAVDKTTPLIGVGGVFSAREAYEKILSGAALVQLYTALIYQGPHLPLHFLKELPGFLDTDGFSTIGEAVGAACA